MFVTKDGDNIFLSNYVLSMACENNIILSHDLTILHAGKAFVSLSGMKTNEIEGKQLSVLNPKVVPEQELFFGLKSSFREINFEFFSSKGVFIHLMLNGFVVQNDECECAVIFWNDITKYTNYEKMFLSKEIELNTLIYKISHDLRGPIASMSGLMSLIKIEESEKKKDQFMGLIDQSLLKLDSKIRNLSKISDSISGKQYYFSDINIHKVVYNTISDLANRFDVSDIVFDFKIDDNINFKTYEFALVSVFHHLWMFSLENRKPGHQLVLRLKIGIKENHLDIKASDNGWTITKDQIDKAYSPFFKTNDISNGTSLSLFTIKKCVDFLNGVLT
jgi:signal transduction histidine kinase